MLSILSLYKCNSCSQPLHLAGRTLVTAHERASAVANVSGTDYLGIHWGLDVQKSKLSALSIWPLHFTACLGPVLLKSALQSQILMSFYLFLKDSKP